MTIRTKLVLLLLAISLTPLLLLAGFSLRTARELGERVRDHGGRVMTERELAHLEEKLSDAVVIFRDHAALLDHLIRDQARSVEAALDRFASPPGTGATAESFDAGEVATEQDTRYRRRGTGGEEEFTPIEVSFAHVVLHTAPDTDEGDLPDDRARLASLAPVYRDIQQLGVARTLWHYTSLENGLHSAFPGHGGYPADFDPRQRDWYRSALQSEGPTWSLPFVDVSTRTVVTSIALAVRRNGMVAGVTAMDVSMPAVFNVFSAEPREWSDASEAMVVHRGEAGALFVHGRERYHARALAWNRAPEPERLDDGRGELAEAFSRAASSGEVGLLRHLYRGEDSLWAFKSIREDGPFLAVVVPVGQVVARAEELEGFVSRGFQDQVWVVGTGLVLIALVVTFVALRTARGVTGPLEALSDTARSIAGGDLSSRAEMKRRDEIGSLADSVDHMAESIQQLINAQEEAFLQSLKSLMNALGTKDQYTAGHSGRVNRYSLTLGQRLGLDEPTLDLLGRGALVHDLGKIGISDAILNKPAPLNDEEVEVMKAHPGYSATIMRPLVRFRAFAEIAAWHHERWDGKGYPDGLAGEEIPLLARIVAIADAWDAMTGDRIYRKGMPTEKALGILEDEQDSGQFDPQLIREFIAMVREREKPGDAA